VTSPDQPGAPTQEELRAYVEQLRRAEPAEILLQAYTMLGTAAEAKMGRPDARVLIDGLAGMVQALGDRLGPQLTAGMRNGLGQLQMMQVEAERQAAAGPAPGPDGAPAAPAAAAPGGQGPPAGQQGAGPSAAAPPGARAQPSPGAPGQGVRPGQGAKPGDDRPMTDRLWIPGRDPRPRP
jgi:hypothetical protein